MMRRTMLPALAIAAWSACCQSALWAQSSEPSYSLDGAWFGKASVPGSTSPVPFMDIFTSDPDNPGQSGSVLCTLQLPSGQSPMGQTGWTPTGHGNWVRIGPNQFAFTVSRIIMDANGRPVSRAKFWGTVAFQAFDTLAGTMNFENYDQNGNVFARATGIPTAETWIGPRLTASPNPIPVAGNTSFGATTIHWSAPDAQVIEIHIGGPDGRLFTRMGGRGSMPTGVWVADGTSFYLQDVTDGKPLTPENTVATLIVHLQKQ